MINWQVSILTQTECTVQWADLCVVDFSDVDQPEGLSALMPVVRDAMHTDGFICIVSQGYTLEQVSEARRSDWVVPADASS